MSSSSACSNLHQPMGSTSNVGDILLPVVHIDLLVVRHNAHGSYISRIRDDHPEWYTYQTIKNTHKVQHLFNGLFYHCRIFAVALCSHCPSLDPEVAKYFTRPAFITRPAGGQQDIPETLPSGRRGGSQQTPHEQGGRKEGAPASLHEGFHLREGY